MAITSEETAALDELSSLINRLESLEADTRILMENWDGRNYDNAIDLTDITDWGGHNFSVVQMQNSVDYLGHLTQFLGGGTVSDTDRWATLSKVKKIAT